MERHGPRDRCGSAQSDVMDGDLRPDSVIDARPSGSGHAGQFCHRIVEGNLRAAMRCYARVSPRGEARDYPGLTVASCGLNCAVFNSALLSHHVQNQKLGHLLALAQTHFRRRGLGWTFWLCEDLVTPEIHTDAHGLFRELQMEPIAQPPGMYAEVLHAPQRRAPELQIRRVSDVQTRTEFAQLSSMIFSLPFPTAIDIYGSGSLWEGGGMTGWIGYSERQPVCIVSIVIGAGAAGVYSVGTLPMYQGRGYAETVMRHALAEAREATGIQASVLQSTEQGLHLYTRMGYQPVTRFTVYMSQGSGLH